MKFARFKTPEELTEFVNYEDCIVMSIVYEGEYILFYKERYQN